MQVRVHFFGIIFANACVNHFFFVILRRIWISMRSIVLVIGIVGVAMVLLCVGIILRKDHSFRSQHIHQNERMRQDKIHCAISEDKLSQHKQNKKMDIKNL